MSDEDHDHWPTHSNIAKNRRDVATGYEGTNGLQSHSYVPIGMAQPPQMQFQPIYYGDAAAGDPHFSYYTHPNPRYQAPCIQGPICQVTQHVPISRRPACLPPTTADVQADWQTTNAWLGRSRAQVDDDNMIMAAREGACAPRKVEPIGLKDTQMMWCVGPDERPTLRNVMDIRKLNGEWKEDPRFGSWFFVCEAEDDKEDEKDVQKGGKKGDKK